MTTNETENENLENRVLVLMPTGRDATLVCDSLAKADITAQPCLDAKDLEEKAIRGGAVLLAEEALYNGTLEHLINSFNNHPVWSDIPVIIFAANAQNSEKLSITVGTRLNATIVERPIRITMLISAVRGALRARERQYQTRDLLNRLEEADQQKDLFLATLSHELRTPLNSIIGWIRLLRGNENSGVDTEHALNVIERNARMQSEMISDILFVSRVITGKLSLKIEPVDLISIVEAAIDILRPSVETKQIRLKTSFDSQAYMIEGDSDRLQQVFWNLISNAVKFTPEQGQINVRVRHSGQNIEIEVSDNGQGIEPQFLPFVFERFRQADSSYTRKAGGLGLGLAIVRHLVELHGGSVSVSSDGENSGTSFVVVLPASKKNRQQASDENPQIKISRSSDDEKIFNGIRILLVEDDDDSREMLKVMFKQYGIEVADVTTAAAAFDEIKKNQTDILVSDVGLPKEDGYHLLQRIRKLSSEQGGQTPAIALTGYANLQDRIQALEAGFQEHLAKPVDLDVLLELIKNLIVRYNLEKKS